MFAVSLTRLLELHSSRVAVFYSLDESLYLLDISPQRNHASSPAF